MEMFAYPPPNPKYYAQLAQADGRPVLETFNVVERLAAEEYQLIVGEGIYQLRDSLLLATPPPHPSEASAQPQNPLDTARKPPTAGSKISLVSLAPKTAALQKLSRTDTPTSESSAPSSHGGSQVERISNSSIHSNHAASRPLSDIEEPFKSPVFGQDNPALTQANTKEGKDAAKKKKPKNNMVKTNSSYVSRVSPAENLSRRLNDHDPNGIFVLININRSFQWLDMSANAKSKAECLTKILFSKAHALCHDINHSSIGPAHIDLVMGFSTSDLIWYEPMSQKYTRINKNGIINATAVWDVKWMPGSENLFLAAHDDGTLVAYDKEKEDAAFAPDEHATASPTSPADAGQPRLQVLKSVRSQAQKTNPVAYWKVCHQRINAIEFSPDGVHLAMVSGDGRLRIIDFHKEELLAVFHSYFGELNCVCWSPDGSYVLTGGQDDLISIWSLAERRLVARFQGHQSWVRWIAFDPWRCDNRNYRFGSVGDDCRLLLWDFNVGMLHTPRAVSARQRASISSNVAPAMRQQADGAKGRFRSDSNLSDDGKDDDSIVHPTDPKSKTPFLRPLMGIKVDDHPLSWLGFQEDCIIASCRRGHVRIWDRPAEGAGAGGEK